MINTIFPFKIAYMVFKLVYGNVQLSLFVTVCLALSYKEFDRNFFRNKNQK